MSKKATPLALLVTASVLSPGWATSVPAQTLQFTAHRDYASGYGPSAIAVGDINGDQRPDLAVAHGFGDAVAVLLGNANGTFQAPRPVYLGPGTNPRSVAIADFNRDSLPDLALANAAANNVSVLLGVGDGTFLPASTVPAGLGSGSLAAADFNGDGRPDLAVANSGAGNVSVLLGNGDGNFQAARNFAADSPAFVSTGDFNRDGRTDLAVASNGSGTVSTLLGNGDGNFQAARTFGAGAGTMSLAVVDVNNDGTPDVAAANNGANTVAVLIGNGDGTLRAAQTFAAGNGPTSVAAGDFNRDGRSDLAVASYNAATSSGQHVAVLIGNGDGTFQAARNYPAGYESLWVATGDFNADGTSDLAVANTFSTTVSILLGRGDGTFPETDTYTTGRHPESVVAADFNRDGRADLAVANAGAHYISILLGNGTGTFQAPANFPTSRGPTSVALGDFNRDGLHDLVVSTYGSADYYFPNILTTVSVLIGNGDGTFQPEQRFEAGPGPNAVAVGDFNGDSVQDLAVAAYGAYPQRNNTVAVLLGTGSGTFGPPQTFTAGNAVSYVAVGDFNRDGRSDLAASNYNDGNVSILLGNGDGTFRAAGTVPTGAAPWFILVEDMNSDQVPDLIVSGHWSDIVSVVLGNGDGTFQPHVWYFTGRGPTGLALADVNSDGRRDVIVTNYFSTTISVFLRNADGTLQPADEFAVDLAPMAVAAGDFNADGQQDLATANYFSFSVSVLINRTFAPRAMAPSFAPPAGTYLGSVTVALSTATVGATIRYTTDGSAPSASSTIYTAPFLVTRTTTVRAMASAGGMTDSEVASATYAIQAAAPTFNPPSGTYVGSVTVALASSTSGATIRYTTDGSTPTAASPVYANPILLLRTTTIRAIATGSGLVDSAVSQAVYTVTAVPPSFSVAGGTYNQPQSVALSTPTSGAAIYYTTDGGTPSTASTLYTGPIAVSRSMTIQAIAVAGGMANSAVASATYTLQAATPTFNPPGGTYLLPQLVELASASPGVTIYYTTDGSMPTTASTRYTGAFFVGVGTTTVRAIAVAPGWSNSAVATAIYRIPL